MIGSNLKLEDAISIVNDNLKDATILAYLFIPNQLYIFRAMSSPIIWGS
jgi:ABC-type microcin C transport system duplicated ATPase subunit YejF